jgi:hypothetical protein
MRIPKDKVLGRLRKQIEAGTPIIGAGTDTGTSAKCSKAGGADIVMVHNSGRDRMAGRGLWRGSCHIATLFGGKTQPRATAPDYETTPPDCARNFM